MHQQYNDDESLEDSDEDEDEFLDDDDQDDEMN